MSEQERPCHLVAIEEAIRWFEEAHPRCLTVCGITLDPSLATIADPGFLTIKEYVSETYDPRIDAMYAVSEREIRLSKTNMCKDCKTHPDLPFLVLKETT